METYATIIEKLEKIDRRLSRLENMPTAFGEDEIDILPEEVAPCEHRVWDIISLVDDVPYRRRCRECPREQTSTITWA